MSTKKQKYCLGFLFDKDASRVALILKNKPAFLAGKFNGLGGKVEPGETSWGAMDREFKEEAGVANLPWHFCARMSGPAFEMDVFSAHSRRIDLVRTKEDEPVGVFEVDKLPYNIVSNLAWLVPMAAHFDGSIYQIQMN